MRTTAYYASHRDHRGLIVHVTGRLDRHHLCGVVVIRGKGPHPPGHRSTHWPEARLDRLFPPAVKALKHHLSACPAP